MATFTELLADVYTLTNRPDLVAESTLAVKVATLKAHQSDYFAKDVRTESVQFDDKLTFQTLEPKTIFPRWRNLKYFRRYDDTATIPGPYFKVLEPDNVLDGYNVHKENIMYLAGEAYQIRSATAFKYALIGFYQFPSVAPAAYISWIAVEHPYLIMIEAAITVFLSIGLRDEASGLKILRDEQLMILKSNNILAEGY